MKIRKKVFKLRSKNYLSSVLLLLVVSCAHRLPQVTNFERFSQQVAARNSRIQSIKSKTTLVISTPTKSYNLKAGILMNDQGSMFIETYGFGVPQAYISVFNQKLKMVLVSQKEIFTGSSKSSLEEVIGIPLEPESLFDPVLRRFRPTSVKQIDSQNKEYLVTDSEENRFYVDRSFRISKIIMKNGEEVEYGKFSNSETNYPQSMKIKWKNSSVQIFFDQSTINQEIVKSLFQIDVPTQGFHVYSIDPHS